MRELTKLEEAACKATDKLNVILHALCNRTGLHTVDVEELNGVISEIHKELKAGLDSVNLRGG